MTSLFVKGSRRLAYVSKVTVEDFDVAMNDLECQQLVVVRVNSCDKEQTRVSIPNQTEEKGH